MLVSRIVPYSVYSSNTRCKTNAANNTAFTGNAVRELSRDFVAAANAVIEKMRMNGDVLEIHMPNTGNTCSAFFGNISDDITNLYLNFNKKRYAIRLDKDGKVTPSSGFFVQDRTGGNLTTLSLENEQEYNHAISAAKIILNGLMVNKNEHIPVGFPMPPVSAARTAARP